MDRLREENENNVSKKWYNSDTVPEGETRQNYRKSLGYMVRPEGIEPSIH
ncbi:hypothetical protein [Candidatus Scalindua japonica]|nr:hypothetical protein [Candidatus Scalindua japonica]